MLITQIAHIFKFIKRNMRYYKNTCIEYIFMQYFCLVQMYFNFNKIFLFTIR